MVSPETSLAERTVVRIQEGLRTHETAYVVQIVELIRELTDKPDTMSVQRLGELIERDLTVTAKLLSVANTIGFNPEGAEIVTTGQAIQAVGFVRIRNLAISLLLLQNANAERNTDESRDVSALAVASGFVAQRIASHGGAIGPTHAFVCAMLRSYGALLLTTFLIDDYRHAQRLEESGDGAGFRRVFGLTPLELGVRLLAESRLPASILSTLRELEPAETATLPGDRATGLVGVCEFADRFTRLLRKPGGDLDQFADAVVALAKAYRPLIDLTSENVRVVVREMNEGLTLLRSTMGLTPLLGRIEALASRRRPLAPAPPSLAPVTAAARPSALFSGIVALSEMLGETTVEADRVFRRAAEVLCEALGLHTCWCFVRGTGDGAFLPRVGVGPGFAGVDGPAIIDARARTIFSVCLERAELVAIHQPDDPKILPFVPAWLRSCAPVTSFVLFPIRRAQKTTAIFLGVGNRDAGCDLAGSVKQQVNVLCRLLAQVEAG